MFRRGDQVLNWAEVTKCAEGEVCEAASCVPGCHGGCPNGYRCDVTSCVADQETVHELAIDVPIVRAKLALTVDGGAPSLACDIAAHAYLSRLRPDGGYAGSGRSADFPCDGGVVELDAIPGPYAVRVYRSALADGGAVWSALPPYGVSRCVVIGASAATTAVDIQVMPVSGRVNVNGATPSVASNCATNAIGGLAGSVLLTTTSGTSIRSPIACDTTDFSFSAAVPPGPYTAWVELPDNPALESLILVGGPDTSRVLRVGQIVIGLTAGTPFVLDVQRSRATGQLLHNGAVPTAIGSCSTAASARATFFWFNDETESLLRVPIPCNSADYGFNVAIPAGTWRPLVRAEFTVNSAGERMPLSSLPLATWTGAAVNFVAGTTRAGDVNVESVQFSGSLKVQGQTPTAAGCDRSRSPLATVMLFSGERTSQRFEIPCDTSDFSFGPLTMPRGTYGVRLYPKEGGSNLPANAGLAPLDLTASGHHVIETRPASSSGLVSGTLTINGESPRVRGGCDGSVAQLRLQRGAFSEALYVSKVVDVSCATSSWTAELEPGNWSVTVSPVTVGLANQSLIAGWPSDKGRAVWFDTGQVFQVGANVPSTSIVVDVPVRWVRANLLVNGAPAAPSSGCVAPFSSQLLEFSNGNRSGPTIGARCDAPSLLTGPLFSGRTDVYSNVRYAVGATLPPTNVPIQELVGSDVAIP